MLFRFIFQDYIFLYLGIGLAVFCFYEFDYFGPSIKRIGPEIFLEARLFNMAINISYIFLGHILDVYKYTFQHMAYAPFVILMVIVGIGARILPNFKSKLIGKKIIYGKDGSPNRMVFITKAHK
jgi:hypothetical protein